MQFDESRHQFVTLWCVSHIGTDSPKFFLERDEALEYIKGGHERILYKFSAELGKWEARYPL